MSCRLCCAELKIEYMGFFALKQNSEKEKHRKLAGIASKPEVQSVLQGFFPKKVTLPNSDTTTSSSQSSSEDNWLVKDVANKAEIISTMQFAANSTPFSSANGLATLYQAQFPDSAIAKMFPSVGIKCPISQHMHWAHTLLRQLSVNSRRDLHTLPFILMKC